MSYTAVPAEASVPAKAKKQKSGGGFKTFVCGFLGAAIACVLCLLLIPQVLGLAPVGSAPATSDDSSAATATSPSGNSRASINVTSGDATLAEAVAEKCLPSVVNIDVYQEQSSRYGFGYGSGDSGSGQNLALASLGSGVVLTEDGYVLTNNHVVEGADALKVTVEGEEYDATFIGSDASSDIAVIKIEGASNLTPMEIGDSDNLTIGEWVMTLGSPFGLEQSVATGIVSATSRSSIMQPEYGSGMTESSIYTNLIQTDAAINPGNSGGALVNKNGQLIGINTLISSYSGNYAGVGFAIPVNYATRLADQIIAGETPSHAQIGVNMTTVTAALAQRNGLSVDYGAYVSSVMAGSGAEQAGIQEGDIIVKVGDQKISSATDLLIAIRSHNPGDEVSVMVNRDGKDVQLDVTLGADA